MYVFVTNVQLCPGDCSQDLRLNSLDYVNIVIAYRFKCRVIQQYLIFKAKRRPSVDKPMCRRHVSLLSRCTPRYTTSLACGSRVLFNVSGEQFCLFRVNVTCLHFCSFTLIRQSDSHFSTSTRLKASCAVACIGHFLQLKIAVSSANVDVVSRVLVGRSAV